MDLKSVASLLKNSEKQFSRQYYITCERVVISVALFSASNAIAAAVVASPKCCIQFVSATCQHLHVAFRPLQNKFVASPVYFKER